MEFITLVVRAPLILVYLAGMGLAAFAWPRQPRSSLLIVGGLGLMTVLELGMDLIGHRLAVQIEMPHLIYFVRNLLEALALGAVIGAAFLGRSGPVPATGSPGSSWPAVAGSPRTDSFTPPRLISKGLYLGIIATGALLTLLLSVPLLLIAAEGRGRDREVVPLLMCPAVLPAMIAVIFQMILLYRLWDSIQDGHARTTPGAAVALLFVPFFNVYWLFQAYLGWAQDYNRLVASRGLAAPRVPEGLALACCILILLGGIPVIGACLQFLTLILMLVFFSRAIDGVNALASQTLPPSPEGIQAQPGL